MQELEDEPEDVRNASPVEDEVRRGQINEFVKMKAGSSTKFKSQKPQHCCRKNKPEVEKSECSEKKQTKMDLPPKPIQFCIEDPYKRIKQELIPRHCMKKNNHLNYLATPKFIRKSNDDDTDEERSMFRKVRTVYPRTEWLAKPTKRRMLMTLVYKGTILPAKKVDYLIEALEDETAITPEQAENLVRDKENAKKKPKKKDKSSKCESKKEPPQEKLGGGDPSLDLEVAHCQYSMAQRFVRSILNWKCTYPRDDYRDIAEVILERLSKQLEYTPIGKEDRKSEQMRILADVFACWISEILIQVAGKYSSELDKEAESVKKQCEDAKKKPGEDNDDYTDEEDGYPKYMEARCGKEQREKCTQSDEHDDEDELNDGADGESATSLDSCVDMEQQTEPKPKMDCGTTTHSKVEKQVKLDECTMADVKCTDQVAIEKIASRIGEAFQTDIPFITFAKIFDTLYCMIGSEKENHLCYPMDNRIHRAIYEKFEEVLCRENPKLLDERMKDILDIITGKLAIWIRKALNKRQIRFFDENPAEVESKEIRDWAKWIDDTADLADGWSNWIHKVTMEAQCIKQAGGITRGDWQDWTGKLESNAMLFRRKYLETIHQQHHNVMMLCDKNVLKTCTKKRPEYNETMIRNTNYEC